MPRKPKKDWCWKRLAANEVKLPYNTRGVRRPEYKINARGITVKETKEKDRRPAVERFFEQIEQVFSGCWLYNGADQFWVNDEIVISPWKFAYEIHHGELAPPHARFGRTCETPGCCQPEHLYILGKKS